MSAAPRSLFGLPAGATSTHQPERVRHFAHRHAISAGRAPIAVPRVPTATPPRPLDMPRSMAARTPGPRGALAGGRRHADNGRMDVTAKLQIRAGQRVATLAGSGDVPRVATADANPPAEAADADAVIAFARNKAELAVVAAPAIEAARQDRLAWVAYPKAGKLGTDLNRDILAALLTAEGVQPVRQVAIDETWSALRFRPA